MIYLLALLITMLGQISNSALVLPVVTPWPMSLNLFRQINHKILFEIGVLQGTIFLASVIPYLHIDDIFDQIPDVNLIACADTYANNTVILNTCRH